MIRTAYLKKAEARLKNLAGQINAIRLESLDETSPETRARYKEQIAILEGRMESVRASVRAVREALGETWGKSKAGVESSLAELKKAVDAAIEKLRKSA